MKESKIITIVLIATGLVFSTFYLATRNITLPDNQAMPWQSYVNDQGETVVFNLTMERSTLMDAIRLFGSESEASLFESNDGRKDLEVFFSSTKVGGLSAKVVLNLDLSNEQYDYFFANIKESMVLPTGSRKTSFNKSAESSMFALTIRSLTFIPRADLSPETIISLFDKPNKIELGDQGVEYWHYFKKGLRIIVDSENKEILEFYNTKL